MAEMNLNVTTQGSLSPTAVHTFYDRQLIANAKKKLVYNQFGQKRNIPKNNGKTINFRRFSPLPKATTPLTEGVTPDGQSLTVTEITATVRQYGAYVATSDVIRMTAIDPIVTETNKLLGAQAGETLDAITAGIVNAGTNVLYAGEATDYDTLSTESVISVKEIINAVRILKNNYAEKIDGSYIAFIHPDVAMDLMLDPKWEDPKKYSEPKDIYDGELGRLYGVRFIETPEAYHEVKETAAGRVPVYSTLIIGENAYGVTTVEGGGLKMVTTEPTDPLKQRYTQGWKAIHVAEILCGEYMVRIESVASNSTTTEKVV